MLRVSHTWRTYKVTINFNFYLFQNPSNQNIFFNSDLENITRVLWVHSESVHVIEAKLRVCKEYEQFISSNNILIHHTLDEYDNICKSIGVQKLESVQKILTSVKKSVPVFSFLGSIVERAADQALSWQNIKYLCFEVDLWDGNTHIGTVHDREYSCYSALTVERLKHKLVEKIFNDITKSLGSTICQGILEHIKSRVKINLKDLYFKEFDFKDFFWGLLAAVAIFLVCQYMQIEIPIRFSHSFLLYLLPVPLLLTILQWSENVNSTNWRTKVAKEVHNIILQHRTDIMSNVLLQIKDMCEKTSTNLFKVSTQMEDWIKRINLVDQTLCKLINQYFLPLITLNHLNCNTLQFYILPFSNQRMETTRTNSKTGSFTTFCHSYLYSGN